MALLLGVLMIKNKQIVLQVLFLGAGLQVFASGNADNRSAEAVDTAVVEAVIPAAVPVGVEESSSDTELTTIPGDTAVDSSIDSEILGFSPEYLGLYEHTFSAGLKDLIQKELQNAQIGEAKKASERALSKALEKAIEKAFQLLSIDPTAVSIDREIERIFQSGKTVDLEALTRAIIAQISKIIDKIVKAESQVLADAVYPAITQQGFAFSQEIVQGITGKKLVDNHDFISTAAQAAGCFLLPFDHHLIRSGIKNVGRLKRVVSGATTAVGVAFLITRGSSAQKYFNEKFRSVIVNSICLLMLKQVYSRLAKNALLKKTAQYALYFYAFMVMQKMSNYMQLMHDRSEMLLFLNNCNSVQFSETVEEKCSHLITEKYNAIRILLEQRRQGLQLDGLVRGQGHLAAGQAALFGQGTMTQKTLDRLETGQTALQFTLAQGVGAVVGGFRTLGEQGRQQHAALMDCVNANQKRQDRLMDANQGLTTMLQALVSGQRPALVGPSFCRLRNGELNDYKITETDSKH
jgi:hypothetical protein